jgi:hypothetical protein
MQAVRLASPAFSAGSRRPPASKSSCTSTIGSAGLSTSHTCAPLACFQCWMGSAACALPMVRKAVVPANTARSASFLRVIM